MDPALALGCRTDGRNRIGSCQGVLAVDLRIWMLSAIRIWGLAPPDRVERARVFLFPSLILMLPLAFEGRGGAGAAAEVVGDAPGVVAETVQPAHGVQEVERLCRLR